MRKRLRAVRAQRLAVFEIFDSTQIIAAVQTVEVPFNGDGKPSPRRIHEAVTILNGFSFLWQIN